MAAEDAFFGREKLRDKGRPRPSWRRGPLEL